MKNLLSLSTPWGNGESKEIVAPSNIPTGGLSGDGGKILKLSLEWLLIAAVLLSLGFIIYGGLNYIMSQGDKTKLESARKTIIFAVVGLIVILLSFFVINLIGSALGVSFIDLKF